jgi:cytochrome c-type biogenesis protein CcmH
MKSAWAVIAWLMWSVVCLAIDTAPAFNDAAQQARYDKLIHELRCLVCRSETIADSNAPLAADLRRGVAEQMRAGKSDDDILKFMTDRYGDYVLYTPPVAPRTWLLWGAPVLFLLAGAAVAAITIVRKTKLPDSDPNDPGLDDTNQV